MALATALGLLKFVPDLVGLFDKDKSVVEKVSDIAKTVTGSSSVNEAEKALAADPDLAYQFKLAVMEDKHVNKRLDEQSRKRASEQYMVNNEQADKIADSVIDKNLPAVGIILTMNILAVAMIQFYAPSGTVAALVAVVSNLCGQVINQLLQERHQVIAFFFGSSLGSKIKSAMGQNKPQDGKLL